MKYLITGATGFVGSALVKKLVENGESVRITVRERNDRRNIAGLAVKKVTADILDRDSIRKAMEGCSHVYHVAGLYRTWMRDYTLLTKVNVQGTLNV